MSFDALLNGFPQGVSLEINVKKELRDKERTDVELKVREETDNRENVVEEAGVITVRTENLEKADVSPVTITTKVSLAWIQEFGIRNVRIAHIDVEGNAEILIPECVPSAKGPPEFICIATTTQGFSQFSLLALAPRPAEFVAQNLVVSPTAVEPGATVTISIDIVNRGATPGSISAILKSKRREEVDFQPVDAKGITLAAGAVGTVRFFVKPTEQGQFQIDVEGLSGAFDVFKILDRAQLSFKNLVITPKTVAFVPDPQERVVDIRLDVENLGNVDGRTELELKINEVVAEHRAVFLPAQTTQPVRFQFIPPLAGDFAVEVEGLTGTIRSVRPADPASFTFATLEPAIPFVTPLEVLTGDELTITFQVTNVGGQRGNQEVILLLNEAEVDSKRVTLERDSGQRVTFILAAPNKPGDYTVRVEELTRLFKVVLPVIPLRINSLLVITPRVQPGGTVFLNVEVENEGDVESTRTFTLTLGRRPFGGVEIETRAVTLPPRQTRTETFTFVAPEVLGTYQVGLEGLLATFEVVRAATLKPESTEGRPWGQPLKKPAGAPLNLG